MAIRGISILIQCMQIWLWFCLTACMHVIMLIKLAITCGARLGNGRTKINHELHYLMQYRCDCNLTCLASNHIMKRLCFEFLFQVVYLHYIPIIIGGYQILAIHSVARFWIVDVKSDYRRKSFNCVVQWLRSRPNCESNNCDGRPRTVLQYTRAFMFANLLIASAGNTRNSQLIDTRN